MDTTTERDGMTDTQAYEIEIVYVGSASHLRRFKVVDGNGKFVPGGLFRTEQEAIAFTAKLEADLLELPEEVNVAYAEQNGGA